MAELCFLNDEDGDAEPGLARWFELKLEGIKFEKTLTLREMKYLKGFLSSFGARHKA